MLGMWLGAALVVAGVVMRFAGVAVLKRMCATHWNLLFDPMPGQGPSPQRVEPLFPGLGPSDFDELIKKRGAILRHLPLEVANLAWWRLGLRNWGRAFFWIGVLVLVRTVWR
jgi:hypothetical protein